MQHVFKLLIKNLLKDNFLLIFKHIWDRTTRVLFLLLFSERIIKISKNGKKRRLKGSHYILFISALTIATKHWSDVSFFLKYHVLKLTLKAAAKHFPYKKDSMVICHMVRSNFFPQFVND